MIFKDFRTIGWKRILMFYGIVLAGTVLARRLPNLLSLLLEQITDISFPFNYNHGIITLAVSLLFYRYSAVSQRITLLGEKKAKSLLFPVVLLSCYSVLGVENAHGMDKHLWALVFCSFALLYNIMEEYAWRGYLLDSLGNTAYVLKSVISGILWAVWHLAVFPNFDQYGGFGMFVLFCLVFSFILTFAASRTRSILVAASIHAFIIQINIAALICLLAFALLLLTWNRSNINAKIFPKFSK